MPINTRFKNLDKITIQHDLKFNVKIIGKWNTLKYEKYSNRILVTYIGVENDSKHVIKLVNGEEFGTVKLTEFKPVERIVEFI